MPQKAISVPPSAAPARSKLKFTKPPAPGEPTPPPLPRELTESQDWKELLKEWREVIAVHQQRRAAYDGREMGSLTPAEQEDARASIWEEERALAGLRQRASVLMAAHGLPKDEPIDTPARLADLIERRWLVSERARMAYRGGADKGDPVADALGILREHEVAAAELLGSVATLPNTGDPVRDVKLLIVRLREPGRISLTAREQECVQALRVAGRRMPGAELSSKAWGGTHRKQLLAQMVSKGILTNTTDERGTGYGLREWTGPTGRV